MRKHLSFCGIFILLMVGMSVAQAGALGVDVNADVDAFGKSQMDMPGLLTFSQKNTTYPLPMFNQPPGDHARYWDNMVEQYQSAQIDFVAVWLKGNNQPATFANLVAAINKRGLSRRIKVMPFDDNPASWTAMRNFDRGDGYGYKAPFDVADPASRAWVWDRNLKVFFQNVPDASRYKIDGRPVYRIWSGAPAFLSNLNGNGSKLLNYIRQQCRAEFGFNPYIMVPEDWVKNDPSSDDPAAVDAVCPWFTPVPGAVYSTWNTHTWHGVTTGTCIPQFHISNNADPNAATWIVDPQHGKTLTDGLKGTAGNSACVATFVEGFDDYWENATLWRCRNLDESGRALGYAKTGYDYPNQRINLVRRFSRNPFPSILKAEAEGCDFFSGAVSVSGKPNFYRNGGIDIEDTTDALGGYDVCNGQAGESLEWREVPIAGKVQVQARVSSGGRGKMHVVIDGVARPSVAVPNTGGGQHWTTVDLGVFTFPRGSYHSVSLALDTRGISVNWWQTQTLQLPDGAYKIVAGQPDTAGGSRTWKIHALGKDRYSVRPIRPDGSIDSASSRRTITPLADGFFFLAPDRQEWSLVPMP